MALDYEEYRRKKSGSTFVFFIFYVFFMFIVYWFLSDSSLTEKRADVEAQTGNSSGVEQSKGSGGSGGAVYVKPFVDRRGRYHKGHVRMPVSTSKHAMKNRMRSNYYYHTRGKYTRRHRK